MNVTQANILNAQRNQRLPKLRARFRCIEWDGKRGCLIDRFKCQYEVTAKDLEKECDGQLDVGEYVSGCIDGQFVTAILIESGPRAVGHIERPKNE